MQCNYSHAVAIPSFIYLQKNIGIINVVIERAPPPQKKQPLLQPVNTCTNQKQPKIRLPVGLSKVATTIGKLACTFIQDTSICFMKNTNTIKYLRALLNTF